LHAADAVAHLNGKTQSAHTDFINAQLARIALALLVIQLQRGNFAFSFSRHGLKIAALVDLGKKKRLT